MKILKGLRLKGKQSKDKMTETEKPGKKKQTIYLNNTNITYPDETGKTTIKRELGLRHSGESSIDSLSEHFHDYFVYGRAVKHLADIGLLGRTIKGAILFAGNLQVYRQEKIPGTEAEMLSFLTLDSGKIWAFAPNTEKYKGTNGLHNLVFGNAESEAGKAKRIEAILQGYEIQRRIRKFGIGPIRA